jgi:hypothetical protein
VRRGIPVSKLKKTRAVVAVAATMLLLLATQANATPSAMTKFISGPGYQEYPGANNNYIAWDANRPDGIFDAWYEPLPLNNVEIKLNPSRTQGLWVSLEQDTNTAIYERYTPTAGGDLYIVGDLANHQLQSPAPGKINTKWEELFPSISKNLILFTRVTSKYTYVILYDRNAGTMKTLAHGPLGKKPHQCVCTYSNSVTDRFATWTHCIFNGGCSTYYYDTNTGITTKFPNSSARTLFYDGAISETTHFMYAIRSGMGCGKNTKVVRWDYMTPGSKPQVVASFPAGIDSYPNIAVTNDGTNDTLYIPGNSCAKPNVDIYTIANANT